MKTKPMKAKQIAVAQREADNAHHRHRVSWLQTHNPVWACGTPVGESVRLTLLNQSLAYLSDPAGAINHCHCQPLCAR